MIIPILISTWLLASICDTAPVQFIYAPAPALAAYQPYMAAGPMLVYSGYPYMFQTRQNQGGINNTQFNEILGIFQHGASQAQGTLGQLQEWGQSWGQSWGQDWGGVLPGNEKLPASTMELKPIEYMKPMADGLEMKPEMKMKLADPEQKQFIRVAGYPQYFGNYAVLPSVFNPILSIEPVQAIRARSLADPNPIKNDKFLAQVAPGVGDVPLVPVGLPIAEPVKYIDSRAAPVEGVEQVEAVVVENEAVKEIPVIPDEKPIVQSRSQNPESSEINAVPVDAAKEVVAESIAQSAPQAAAIAGKGGMAEAAPVATAIVGKDGLAIAQPVASAVAGEFGGSVKHDHPEEPESEPSKDKVE